MSFDEKMKQETQLIINSVLLTVMVSIVLPIGYFYNILGLLVIGTIIGVFSLGNIYSLTSNLSESLEQKETLKNER